MSMKVIGIIIIIAILAIGGWLYFSQQTSTQSAATNGAMANLATGTEPTPPVISAHDNSDAALDSDMTSIDMQMKSLDGDSAQADASLNAQ